MKFSKLFRVVVSMRENLVLLCLVHFRILHLLKCSFKTQQRNIIYLSGLVSSIRSERLVFAHNIDKKSAQNVSSFN